MATPDEEEQLRLAKVFEAHAAHVGTTPSVLGMIMSVEPHSPMHGTGCDGGPVIGWEDLDVVLAQGCASRRYFTKNTIGGEITVQYINGAVMRFMQSAMHDA